jgi:hypothetical protein
LREVLWRIFLRRDLQKIEAALEERRGGEGRGVAESGCGSSSFGSSKIRSCEMISAEKALNLM